MFSFFNRNRSKIAPALPDAHAVPDAITDPFSITSTELSNAIVQELNRDHPNDERWQRYTEILFDRTIQPYQPLLNFGQPDEDTPDHLLRHAMESYRDIESNVSPVSDYVERLARDVMRDNRSETGFHATQNAFHLLHEASRNDIIQMNAVITAKNNRTDEMHDKIDLSFNIITSTLGVAVGILTALPSKTNNDNTSNSESTIYSDGKKMSALVLSAVITLIGGIRQAVDKYLAKTVPLMPVPDHDEPEAEQPHRDNELEDFHDATEQTVQPADTGAGHDPNTIASAAQDPNAHPVTHETPHVPNTNILASHEVANQTPTSHSSVAYPPAAQGLPPKTTSRPGLVTFATGVHGSYVAGSHYVPPTASSAFPNVSMPAITDDTSSHVTGSEVPSSNFATTYTRHSYHPSQQSTATSKPSKHVDNRKPILYQ